MLLRTLLTLVFTIPLTLNAAGQDPHHSHAEHTGGATVQPPRVFLDKSPRIVQYQLDRLDNERLLLVERHTNDAKYAPVFAAILSRAGMSPQYREEALGGLVELNRSDAAAELLKALASLDPGDRQQARTGREIARLLLQQPPQDLDAHTDALRQATKSDNSLLRSVGYAGLVVAGHADAAWSEAQRSDEKLLAWLGAVSLVPRPQARSALRPQVAELTAAEQPVAIRKAAVVALASVPTKQTETFQLVAPLFSDPELRDAAVRTLLAVPQKQRDAAVSAMLAGALVKHAEETPAAERTSNEFIDAMQLADQLLARLPAAAARSYRERLRAVTVRVVRIQTVEEEMRYDIPYFAVEAGRPVQVILRNEDLMPHNLVITVPDALQDVAELGFEAGPMGHDGKEYVPNSDKVLHATHMVQPHRQERLTFTAPAEPGEYPYVCTFPRHWMRMYGVMVVVPDLDAWLQDPIEPKDPVGSNRSFVQAWTADDLSGELDVGLRGRTPEIGARLFKEATCAQCHKVNGQGGAVGPELADVFKRWKGDRLAVLREILDPSHRIDPKYAVHVVTTTDGRVLTGIVTAEDSASVSILDNPEAPQPTVIKRSDIDEMLKTSKSMMPKALLDRFSKDEVFEVLAYLEGLSPR